jgi:hypothetical protein
VPVTPYCFNIGRHTATTARNVGKIFAMVGLDLDGRPAISFFAAGAAADGYG